jgi:hypothetical protein
MFLLPKKNEHVAGEILSEKEADDFADAIINFVSIDNDTIVFHSNMDCDIRRLHSTLQRLPDAPAMEQIKRFDVLREFCFANAGLVSKKPADEQNPSAPIYIPEWGASTIYTYLNHDSDGKVYVSGWGRSDIENRVDELGGRHKSAEDAFKTFEAYRAFKELQDGKLFAGDDDEGEDEAEQEDQDEEEQDGDEDEEQEEDEDSHRHKRARRN